MPRAPHAEEPVGFRVEDGAELDDRQRVEDFPALLAPLDDGVIGLNRGEGKPARVDRACFAIVPASTYYRLSVLSPLVRLVTLLLRPEACTRAHDEYRGYIDSARFHDLLGIARVLPRTRWVDEVLQRYVFERVVCEKSGSAAAVFLETEIAKEVYFLCKERDEEQTRTSVVHEAGDIAGRARAWIEQNLFEPLRVGDLARRCHTSESTLLRAFQRELHTTPANYARARRLDAALLLLKSGRYTVSQVAARVGYRTLPSFTVAFQRRFAMSPSTVRHTDDALEVLPAHGTPPTRKR